MKSCVPRQQSILLHNLGTKQPIASIFFNCSTIEYRYINFWSYLNFHKMRDVPGFLSAVHNEIA